MANNDRLPAPVTEAVANLVVQHPYFAVYMYDLMKLVPTRDMPTAATNGKTIYVNDEWFGGMNIKERVFVLAHEICHGMLQHITRAKLYHDRGFGPDLKPFNSTKWNQATDYVINAILTDAGIGAMPCGKNQGLYNPQFTAADLADDVYLKLPDDDDSDNFDDHLEADSDDPPPDDVEVKNAMTSAKNAAKAQGNLPAGIERLFGEILDPKTDWRKELRDYMMLTAGNEENTWNKPHRRRLAIAPHMIFPGSQGYGCKHVVLINDTSGSVSQEETTAYLAEQAGILEDCKPEAITLLWVDMDVSGVDELEEASDLNNVTPKGGGGTDMTAGFRYIDENGLEPDVVVVLTDGYTPFGDEPAYPVVWVTTGKADMPYGKVIELEV